MDFGNVIRAMKKDPSKRFARAGWDGRGMFIYLTPGSIVEGENWRGELTPDEAEAGVAKVLPHIDMYSATGERVIGWLASQTDMLTDDWYEVGGMVCPECSRSVVPELGCTVANSTEVWTELLCPVCKKYLGRTC